MVPSCRSKNHPQSAVRHAIDAMLLASCLFCSLACGSDRRGPQEHAVAVVEQFGGSIVRDVERDGDPVVKVDLADKPVSDTSLVALGGLTQLKNLVLRKTARHRCRSAMPGSDGQVARPRSRAHGRYRCRPDSPGTIDQPSRTLPGRDRDQRHWPGASPPPDKALGARPGGNERFRCGAHPSARSDEPSSSRSPGYPGHRGRSRPAPK